MQDDQISLGKQFASLTTGRGWWVHPKGAKSMAALGSAVERTGLALGGPFSSTAGWYFLRDLIRCLLIGGRG